MFPSKRKCRAFNGELPVFVIFNCRVLFLRTGTSPKDKLPPNLIVRVSLARAGSPAAESTNSLRMPDFTSPGARGARIVRRTETN